MTVRLWLYETVISVLICSAINLHNVKRLMGVAYSGTNAMAVLQDSQYIIDLLSVFCESANSLAHDISLSLRS